MSDFKEKVIEWLTGQDRATLSLSQRRTITRVKKLAEQYPEEVQIVAENRDGSICVHMPVSYILIRKPRVTELGDEERKRRRLQLEKVRPNSRAGIKDEDLYAEGKTDGI